MNIRFIEEDSKAYDYKNADVDEVRQVVIQLKKLLPKEDYIPIEPELPEIG